MSTYLLGLLTLCFKQSKFLTTFCSIKIHIIYFDSLKKKKKNTSVFTLFAMQKYTSPKFIYKIFGYFSYPQPVKVGFCLIESADPEFVCASALTGLSVGIRLDGWSG